MIHSDQGPEFVNSVMSEVCEITGIRQSMTKGNNPRENGITERAIGTITRMLKKKTVIPAQWDILLPMVVFAYNSAPHEAIGDSPFYMLHAFDPNQPSNEIPSESLSWNHVDFDDYKYELLTSIQHLRDCSRGMSEEYRNSMKQRYDARNKVEPSKLPRVGDRVYVRLPGEKNKSKHPKLVDCWSGPFRVIEVSENSALLSNIAKNEDPIRIQHDMVMKVPHELDDTPIETKTKRVKRGRKANKLKTPLTSACCRATTSRDPAASDNSALGLFFTCPGSGRRLGTDDPEEYHCTIRDMTFADVAPDETDVVIRSLRVQSIFSLARMISIYENEVDVDKKRFLMRSPNNNFVTIAGAEKAYTFYKRNCEHVLKALLVHDGSRIAMAGKDVDIEISQLNDLANAGVQFAQSNSWDDVNICGPVRKTVILAPGGFRGYEGILKLEEGVDIIIYSGLKDVVAAVGRVEGINTCIFLTPTSQKPYDATEWPWP
ncbi:hypothetical protein Y032_0007g3355 [Ancylostoma ceylanicum]|uniref:Integrase catalytic domain-containing protein n=1 Tax=Ancylostoma ceylanicum TaxID=53326 RepID=A0A016VMP4_9BILA|nr:hypothetical protein Y032_0007g3355 [Ancylostoma ceylanicum]